MIASAMSVVPGPPVDRATPLACVRRIQNGRRDVADDGEFPAFVVSWYTPVTVVAARSTTHVGLF